MAQSAAAAAHTTMNTLKLIQNDDVSNLQWEEKVLESMRDSGDAYYVYRLLKELDSSANVNSIRDTNGMSLLHLACCWDWSIWEEVVKLLVEKHQSDISGINKDGDTPLHVASQFSNVGAVRYLLKFESCDRNMRNKSGRLPLDVARHSDVVKELLLPVDTPLLALQQQQSG